MADHQKKGTESWGFGFRRDRKGWRIWGNFPPLSRHVRAVAQAFLAGLLLVLIAKLTGFELSAMLEFIRAVTEMLL